MDTYLRRTIHCFSSILFLVPLCPTRADHNNLSAIEFGHFLTTKPLNALSNHDLSHLEMTVFIVGKYYNGFIKIFLPRWRRQSPDTFQRGTKRFKPSAPSVEINTAVINLTKIIEVKTSYVY